MERKELSQGENNPAWVTVVLGTREKLQFIVKSRLDLWEMQVNQGKYAVVSGRTFHLF